jgi:uncharacterized RDD family membrane protein YckC
LNLATPTLTRRLVVMVYESLLLFGVLFAAVLVFELATRDVQWPLLPLARQIWVFIVLGAYFVHCWRKTGQTLAMKTWRIRLVSTEGGPVRTNRAMLRYLLSWMWFLPALVAAHLWEISRWPSLGLIAAGFTLWACTVFLDKHRQFLHDRLAGTRLVFEGPVSPAAK